jgi:GT2 family glycosyltransferase
MVTHCISTFNNLPYLRLVLKSIKLNAHFKEVIVYAENCTDGTNEWLECCHTGGDITFLIEKNEIPVGIGGGMNKVANLVKTPYLNFLHSDMYVTKDFDLPLYDIVRGAPKTIASSWRIEPDIFGGTDRFGTTIAPKDEFGELHSNFNSDHFDEWAQQFIKNNDIQFRKAEGVSFMIRKSDWDGVGGCAPAYSPAAFDDHDLFLRMTALGFNFVETSKSLVYHFGARGSIFRGDDFTKVHSRQVNAEKNSFAAWMEKWRERPTFDSNGFIVLTPTLKSRMIEIGPQKFV